MLASVSSSVHTPRMCCVARCPTHTAASAKTLLAATFRITSRPNVPSNRSAQCGDAPESAGQSRGLRLAVTTYRVIRYGKSMELPSWDFLDGGKSWGIGLSPLGERPRCGLLCPLCGELKTGHQSLEGFYYLSKYRKELGIICEPCDRRLRDQ